MKNRLYICSIPWSTGGVNDNPLEYPCLKKLMKSIKRQKDMTLEDETLFQLEGFQYTTGEERLAPEIMKRLSQSRNEAQLQMYLVVKVKSDVVKNNIA